MGEGGGVKYCPVFLFPEYGRHPSVVPKKSEYNFTLCRFRRVPKGKSRQKSELRNKTIFYKTWPRSGTDWEINMVRVYSRLVAYIRSHSFELQALELCDSGFIFCKANRNTCIFYFTFFIFSKIL